MQRAPWETKGRQVITRFILINFKPASVFKAALPFLSFSCIIHSRREQLPNSISPSRIALYSVTTRLNYNYMHSSSTEKNPHEHMRRRGHSSFTLRIKSSQTHTAIEINFYKNFLQNARSSNLGKHL